jgi:hypothetical protein
VPGNNAAVDLLCVAGQLVAALKRLVCFCLARGAAISLPERNEISVPRLIRPCPVSGAPQKKGPSGAALGQG